MRETLTKPERWAELRDDLSDVSNGDRRAAMLAFERASKGDSDLERAFVLSDELIILMVTAWSFSFPIPSIERESLQKLPAHDYDKLGKICTGRQDELWPKFEVDPEPDSPTEPSAA